MTAGQAAVIALIAVEKVQAGAFLPSQGSGKAGKAGRQAGQEQSSSEVQLYIVRRETDRGFAICTMNCIFDQRES